MRSYSLWSDRHDHEAAILIRVLFISSMGQLQIQPVQINSQLIIQSSLKLRLYIVLSTIFSIFFQSDRLWMNSYTSFEKKKKNRIDWLINENLIKMEIFYYYFYIPQVCKLLHTLSHLAQFVQGLLHPLPHKRDPTFWDEKSLQ